MRDEIRTLKDNHTQDIVPYPARGKLIGSKWIYTIKMRANGSIERYKVHLVALEIDKSMP